MVANPDAPASQDDLPKEVSPEEYIERAEENTTVDSVLAATSSIYKTAVDRPLQENIDLLSRLQAATTNHITAITTDILTRKGRASSTDCRLTFIRELRDMFRISNSLEEIIRYLSTDPLDLDRELLDIAERGTLHLRSASSSNDTDSSD